MSLETKGTIKYDPDVKDGDDEYVVECKPLGICEGGSGVLETDIETLTEKVRAAISDEFHIPPCDVVLARYSMSLTFDVSAPVHKTLDQFTVSPTPNDDSKITVTFGDRPPIETNLEQMKLANKTMEMSRRTGIPPEKILEAAKKVAKKKKGKEAPG
jgi:hypothetical protein